MATKKAASTKKSAAKKPAAKKQTTTKVTTVRATEAEPISTAATATTSRSSRMSLSRAPIVAALIAEFVGTFVFAATIIAGQGQPILVFFALAAVVLMVGTFSGGYVNPALTIAAWVTRRISALRALGYIIAQVLGAMLALVVLNMYLGAAGQSANDLYNNAPALFKASPIPAGKEWLVLLAEIVGITIFGFAVAAATRIVRDRTATALTVGLGLFLGLMVAGSAAAMISASAILNPAVAVALQVNFANVWTWGIYVLGSSLGAILGFGLHDLLRSSEARD